MIAWTKKVYFSENIKEKKREKLRRKLEKSKLLPQVYVVALPTNPDNLLDIISAGELKFPHYKRNTTTVCGVAKGKDEAEELVRLIVEEMYNATSDFDVLKFMDETLDRSTD